MSTAQEFDARRAGVVEIATRIAAAAIDRNVWDEEQPSLGYLTHSWSSPFGVERLASHTLDLPPGAWDDAEAYQVLRAVAATLEEAAGFLQALPRSFDVVATMLLAETWGLEVDDPGERDRHPASIADDPDAFEAKSVLAVDSDGWTYIVEHRRGEALPTVQTHPPTAPERQVQGRLVDGLRAILAALRGKANG